MTEAPQPKQPAEQDSTTPRPVFDGASWFFVLLAAVSALLVTWIEGIGGLARAMTQSATLLMTVAPMILVGLFLGGLVKELSDPRRIAPVLGARSGWKGLVLATALGAATPGGPFAAFPIVYALSLAGADMGAVVAYLTAWSVLGLHRLVIWELPLLGSDFVVARALASLPLPLIAGFIARLLIRALPGIPIGRGRAVSGGA
ncbi:MAG: permease [Hyphomicrobiaceae bacterium]|nr:permease [Hyphomicrobiaceae bacterium]